MDEAQERAALGLSLVGDDASAAGYLAAVQACAAGTHETACTAETELMP